MLIIILTGSSSLCIYHYTNYTQAKKHAMWQISILSLTIFRAIAQQVFTKHPSGPQSRSRRPSNDMSFSHTIFFQANGFLARKIIQGRMNNKVAGGVVVHQQEKYLRIKYHATMPP